MRCVGAFAVLALSTLMGVACSTKAKLVGQGGECQFATDCEEGLVCLLQTSGARTCGSDLSGVQKTENPPADAATRDAATDAPARDGGRTDATPDSSPPADSAPPEDSAPSEDSSPPVDSAPPDDAPSTD